MVVKTTYDKINISFCVEQNKVSVLAEHLPKMPTASWEMYNDIGINYDFGEDYVLLSTLVRHPNRPVLLTAWPGYICLPCGL